MPLPDLPHLDLPFRFVNGELACVDQDSVDDYENQVMAVVLCPVGFRDELPEFGIPEPEFGRIPLDTTGIQAAIDEWVPNSHVDITQQHDAIQEAVSRLTFNLNPEQDEE
jgi:hypothetical protein